MTDIVEAVKAAGEHYEDALYELGVDYYDDCVHEKSDSLRRWSHYNYRTYQYQGKFYTLVTDEPATEYQEGMDRFVDFYEVEAHTETVIQTTYKKK